MLIIVSNLQINIIIIYLLKKKIINKHKQIVTSIFYDIYFIKGIKHNVMAWVCIGGMWLVTLTLKIGQTWVEKQDTNVQWRTTTNK